MSGTDQVFGNNSATMLRGFVDRIENVNGKIDDLVDDRRVIVAELKAAGFAPKYVARIIRKRKMKPHDRQEDEALEATYLHAAGLALEPPLFRALGALARDVTSQEKVLDTFKKLVPPEGEIIIKLGDKRMRLWRDSKGEVQAEPWVAPDDKPRAERSTPEIPRRVKPEVPDVDEAGARALGGEYARDNRPVTDNPFPYGDKRRPLFDEGWREANGGSYSRQRRRSMQAADDHRNEEVNTLLQRLEQHKGFLIAATNFGGSVDQAIWRRFDIHITLELPGQEEREKIMARYLAPFGLPKRALYELAIGPKLRMDMRKEAVIGRLIGTVQPHPDLGKPRLWTNGEKDHAVQLLPWPLPKASEVSEMPETGVEEAEQMGRSAATAGKPIIENPFPFGDPRRARFDEGWRKESDSDGMGGTVVPLHGAAR